MYPRLNFILFEVSAYLFFTILALMVVVIGSYFFAGKRGFKIGEILIMLFGMGLSSFIGARLLNVFVNYEWYFEDFFRIFSFNAKGLSLYGGIGLAMITGLIISYFRKIPLLKFADTVVPFLGIGVALMRLGCFLNGCCFGKETGLPWGVVFPALSPAHKHQIAEDILAFSVAPVHPTQLYELFGAITVSIIAFFLIKKKMPDGTASLTAAIIFSLIRWINIYFRVLPYDDIMIYYFYPLFYLVMVLGCGYWLYRIIRKARN